MNIWDLEVMGRYIRMCDDGWRQGWHERNGGNLTYRLSNEEAQSMRPFFYERPGEWTDMGVWGPALASQYFISTGSGKYLRNVILAPEDSLCVLEINGRGDQYRVVWGLPRGGTPTSEFPTHFMNHAVRAEATKGLTRVIYHAHPASLIALSYILPLTDRAFSRALWQSATECPVVFPGGVGVVPWMVPGGAEIALATSEKMKEFEAVVWAMHGLFVSGPDFDTTFGLMHTIEKSADICLKVLSSGQPIRQTITDDNLRAIAKAFGAPLRMEFLESV